MNSQEPHHTWEYGDKPLTRIPPEAAGNIHVITNKRPSVSTARPVCTARPSVSTARPVCTARPSVSTARPVCTARPSVSTARPVCTPKPNVSTARPVYATRPTYPRIDNVRPRGSCSPIKRAVVNTGKAKLDTDLKKSRWVWRPKGNYFDHVSKDSRSFMLKKDEYVDLKGISKFDHAVVDSGCSSHMTGNKAYLSDYEDFNGGFVAFGSDPKGDELKFNLFSISQMCDKKYSVIFTKSECLILSPSFKLLDESQVVLRAPRKDDVYSLDLKNIVPSGGNRSETSRADELEMMVTQEVVANAMNDESGQAFLKKLKNELSSRKKDLRLPVLTKLSTVRHLLVSGANADKSSLSILEAKYLLMQLLSLWLIYLLISICRTLEDVTDTSQNDG
ncbi:hypothetical protein Tco_0420907 [Tanacetum coccineum]